MRQLYELGVVGCILHRAGFHTCSWQTPRTEQSGKSFTKNKFSEENHPKSDPDCALGVHSASNQHNERRYEFYWGYKSHVLVDCISGLPLYELTTPGNIADSAVAAEILAAADQTISLKECAFLADKGYDAKSIYNTVKSVYDGEAFVPLDPRGAKASKTLSAGNPIYAAGLAAMHKDGKTTDNGRTRQKYCCRFRQSKTECLPLQPQELEQWEEKPGLHEIQDRCQTITDFPLTGNACVLSVSMPCVQSAKDTIPVSNPQVRNGCGCATAPARRTSIHWLISPPWRLRWPPFCTAHHSYRSAKQLRRSA